MNEDEVTRMIDEQVGSILGASVEVRPSIHLASYDYGKKMIELSLHAVRLPKLSLLLVLFHEAAHRRQHIIGCSKELRRKDHCANWSVLLQMMRLGVSSEDIKAAYRTAAENA